MDERPLHVTRMVYRWLRQKDCKHTIFNLKLPMKKRCLAMLECEALIRCELHEARVDYMLAMKQLYHDRKETTLCLLRVENQAQ